MVWSTTKTVVIMSMMIIDHGLGDDDDDGHGLDDNDAGQLLGQGKDDALKEVGMVAKETSRLPTLRIIEMD